MRVIETLRELFCRQYGCDPEDVEMPATLDALNIAPYERAEMALILSETYGVDMTRQDAAACETVEDVVAFVEDRLIEREEQSHVN